MSQRISDEEKTPRIDDHELSCLISACVAQPTVSFHPRTMLRVGNDLINARAELAKLREIVDKLPKTADGVPIVPGMPLFFWTDDRELYEEKASPNPLENWEQGPGDCYSTKAAALGARASKPSPDTIGDEIAKVTIYLTHQAGFAH